MVRLNFEYVSKSSIGGRIKKIREYRGLTQQELGLKCGFSESTADVRIGQYEANKKAPRLDAIKKLAAGLNIDEHALYDTDLGIASTYEHILFDMEEFMGLRPVEINGILYLAFDEPIDFGQSTSVLNHGAFLREWYNAIQQYTPSIGDSEEIIKQKQKDYTLWKYEYPNNISHETRVNSLLSAKKELEEELKKINDALYNSEE